MAFSKERVWSWLGVSTPFDPNHKLVTSPWLPPVVLAAIRMTIAIYTLTTLLTVVIYESTVLHDSQSFLSYFTDLTNIGLCAYFWASGVQSVAYILNGQKSYPLQRWPRFLQFLHVLLFSTISTFPFVVTAVFWSVLATPETFKVRYSAWSNTSMHALDSVWAAFEIFMTHMGPSAWVHMLFCLCFLAMYLGLAYVTYDTQHFYTYSFLNPAGGKGKLAGYIVGIAVGEIVLFAVVWVVCWSREWVSTRFRYKKDVSSEGTTEWLDISNAENGDSRQENKS